MQRDSARNFASDVFQTRRADAYRDATADRTFQKCYLSSGAAARAEQAERGKTAKDQRQSGRQRHSAEIRVVTDIFVRRLVRERQRCDCVERV